MRNPLVRWRDRRIVRIERRVAKLTDQIDRAWKRSVQEVDPAIADVYGRIAVALEEQRRRLWLQRSDIVKKQPPIYEGDIHP